MDKPVQIGQYFISKWNYNTLQGDRVESLWIESPSGEGMEVKPSAVPENATVEWMDEFWRENF
jgi:hypothetical protein